MTRSFFSIGNLSLVGVAFILALMVWIVATMQENPFVEATLPEKIPVEVVNRGEGLVIVRGMEDGVSVKVRAPESVWEDLSDRSFRAYVDLQGLDVGLHEVPVKVEPASSLVRILQTSPSVLTLRLDRRMEKVVPVVATIYGDPALGYEMGHPVVDPSHVTVSGPASLVDQVVEVTAEVILRGEKETVERTVSPTPTDEVGNVVSGVELDQVSVRVTVPIEQRVGFRELAIKAVTEGTPAPGYWISSISVDPSTITVVGDPATVAEIPGYLETSPIDVDDAREDISQQVPLLFPEGVSPLENVPTVQAHIEISPVLGGQTIQLTPVVQGLGRGLEADFSPDTVEVILSGPLSELEALEPGDVRVVLDLSDYEPGTHFVPLTVVRPRSLVVQAILPDQLEVVIRES
jgi:YbbR domain-containing protein